jgi:hypothetical protein
MKNWENPSKDNPKQAICNRQYATGNMQQTI